MDMSTFENFGLKIHHFESYSHPVFS